MKAARVWVSTSDNIFKNLALEEWLYRKRVFAEEPALLLWRNQPCVVVGRHQNPWTECRLPYLREKGITLARRNSGGGTVYHDLGNLNCTFFTDRKSYNRRNNLLLVTEALNSQWGLNLRISERDAVYIDDKFKISGTAAKLGNPNAYHHFTVMFNVNKDLLVDALSTKVDHVDSKATASIPSLVGNLKDFNAQVDFWPLVEAISEAYVKQSHSQVVEGKHWMEIKPEEEFFPGLVEIVQHFSSWQWIFGHTPRFTVKRQFAIPRSVFIRSALEAEKSLQSGVPPVAVARLPFTLEIVMEVYKAKVEKFSLSPAVFLPRETLDTLNSLVVGQLFNDKLLESMGGLVNTVNIDGSLSNNLKFVVKCLQDLIKYFQ